MENIVVILIVVAVGYVVSKVALPLLGFILKLIAYIILGIIGISILQILI